MTDPSLSSAQYDAMAQKWVLPQTLMGGTPAMRAAGARFLPRHPAESSPVYAERAKRAVLRNYYRRTVQKIVGRVFSNPVIPDAHMPGSLKGYLQNIDMTGRGMTSFAQSWFQDALVCGLSYVLVDFPDMSKARAGDARPYAVHIPAERLIATQWENSGAGPQLVQIRIRETVTGYQDFTEQASDQIRVLEPHQWRLYRKSDKEGWQLVDQGENSLGEIPLVTLYANRTGLMQATPPLEDLAYMNLEHYQIRSDQRNALNVASFPILAASGYDPEIDGPIEVGPNKVLTTSDTDGKYYYVESTGAALEAGARELAALEKSIQLFGLQFEAGSSPESATGRALDAADAMSPITAMIMELEDSLNRVLRLFAKWSGIDAYGSLQIQEGTAMVGQNSTSVGDLLSLMQAGAISLDQLRDQLNTSGILKDRISFNAASD